MKNQTITFINFRDMGGLQTPDGRIKAKKLFRTAVIAPKTDADRALLERCALQSVIDLRTRAEAREKPDKLPEGIEYVSASVFDDDEYNVLAPTRKMIFNMLKASEQDLVAVRKKIIDSYTFMPFNSTAYGEIFRRMDEGKTLAFHCTAGKDRTGIAALMIELALGRTPEQALSEYMASNALRKQTNDKMEKRMKLIRTKSYITDFSLYASQAHEELFNTALQAVEERCGSFKNFLKEMHGIDEKRIELWKTFYLE